MLYILKYWVRIPEHWDAETEAQERAKEAARAKELIADGYVVRAWRSTATQATIALWQAKDHDDLHEAFLSLPLHRFFFDVEVTPVVEHPVSLIAKEAGIELPAV